MNWTYLAVEALLPLAWAMGATLLGGTAWALRLHRGGGSSRVALGRFLRALCLLFPLAFLLASLWESRGVLRGLVGVALHHPQDQRAMGLLRLHGEGFLKPDPMAAVDWFRKASQQGDRDSQLDLARALASGRGTARNSDEALHWAESSAQQGLIEAMIFAGDLWRPRDVVQARGWYLKALTGLQPGLRQRDPQACFTFGLMCCGGKGLAPDQVEGLAWMRVAEQRGLPRLQTITIRLMETQTSPAQREGANLRAQGLLTPP